MKRQVADTKCLRHNFVCMSPAGCAAIGSAENEDTNCLTHSVTQTLQGKNHFKY